MTQTFEQLVLPLYDTYVKVATKWCYGDVHKAEDMVQEAMVKAFIHFPEYDSKYKIATWFHRILHNTVMDAMKVEERTRSRYYDYFVWKGLHDPFYSMDISEEEQLHQDCLNRLPEIIGALPPTDQTIITMYMNGENHQKIGQAVGLTRAGATSRIRKICKRIHEDLVNKI